MICSVSSISSPGPAAYVSRWPGVVSFLVLFGSYGLALALSPGLPDHLVRAFAVALAALWCGVWCGFDLHAAWVFAFGRRCGVHAQGVLVGMGPAWRTRVGDDRVTSLRRGPVPLVRVVPAYSPGPNWPRGFRLWAATLLAAQTAVAGLFLGIGGPFGCGAATALGGTALVRFFAPPAGRLLLRPVAAGELDRWGLLAGSGLNRAAASVLEGRPADARQALQNCPPQADGPQPVFRLVEARVLLLEGRYAEAAEICRDVADLSALPASVRMVAHVVQARALAYALESASAPADAHERFRALVRELREAPAAVTSGADVTALYYLLKGNVDEAISEARHVSRIGGAPAGRCLALCTFAVCLHRAGRMDDARQALTRARELAPEVVRVAFVERLLAGATLLSGC
jgi:hypothetical protein